MLYISNIWKLMNIEAKKKINFSWKQHMSTESISCVYSQK